MRCLTGEAARFSVADAAADEGGILFFRVTLSRTRESATQVDYATSDGTARAGADYTAASGTLVFYPGDQTKMVTVTVLDDAHDDGGETLTLTLSNPVEARIEDGTATGTIVNSDPLPKAWMARFGRTVAGHPVDALEAPRYVAGLLRAAWRCCRSEYQQVGFPTGPGPDPGAGAGSVGRI